MSRPRLTLAPVALALAGALALPASASAGVAGGGASPNAGDLGVAFWVMLAVAALLVVAVHAALLLVARRFRARRGHEPEPGRGRARSQLRIATFSGVLSLAVIAFGSVMTALPLDVKPSGPGGLQAAESRFAQYSISEPPADPAPLHIRATGRQWLWRFDYPDEPDEPTPGFDERAGFAQTFSYHTLVIPVDTTVILDVRSTDVVHTWWVPDLGPQVDAVPGERNRTWLRADRTGTFEGRSATLSGPAYATMRIRVAVVEPEEFRAYLAGKSDEIRRAQQAVQEQIDEEGLPSAPAGGANGADGDTEDDEEEDA